MLLHNNNWDIVRNGADYWLRPPASIEEVQGLIRMPSRNALLEAAVERRHAS